MSPVLADTGVLVAAIDVRQQHHRTCARVLELLDRPIVTCEAVIAESAHLLRRFHPGVPNLLKNIEAGVIDIPFRLSESAGRVRELMDRYADVPASYADASLICLAEEVGSGDILTLDSDFQVYRWDRDRRFRNLVPLS